MEQEYVCKCCLVTEEEIIDTVQNDNVTTIQELRGQTAATSGCGKCTIMCEHIMQGALAAKMDK